MNAGPRTVHVNDEQGPGTGNPERGTAAAAAAGAVAFVVLATANAAGYRYGVSDQAFYIPAILDDIQPALFPGDSALIESQARLMVLDEAIAALVNATGASLPALFIIGYLLSLLLLYAGLAGIGRTLYASRWTVVALLAASTLRHRIPKTSANSFEPYFHPRMLAFAVGALAVAALLRRRRGVAVALTAAALVVHPTTGLYFAILVGVALFVSEPALRLRLGVALALCAAGAAAALRLGALGDAFVLMDPSWRLALASKDSVFPATWPAWAWAANLALYGIWVWAYRVRRRLGHATPEDMGLLAGGGALLALFVVTLPLVEIGVAFFVQLQVGRVFWLIDLLATAYVMGTLERAPVRARPRLLPAAICALLALSLGRGVYILTIEHPERSLFEVQVPASPWLSTMQWLAAQPVDVEVLADPGHAWKYGTSVRVTAGRDVFLEEVKDSAVAMYSRDVAMRVLERTAAVGDFSQLTAERARALDARYDLDYVVTTASLALPVAYRSAPFTVYSLR